MTRLRELQDALDVLRDVHIDVRHIFVLQELPLDFKNHRPFEFEGEEETYDVRRQWCLDHKCPEFFHKPATKGYNIWLRKNPNPSWTQLMKFYYTDERIQNLAASDHPLLKLIKKDTGT